MRNIDRIKDLEKELGRYRKKVADQQKEIDGLREQVVTAHAGLAQLSMGMDAFQAQTALKYGTMAIDEDTGEELGWNMLLPLYSMEETVEKYEVHTWRKEQEYFVGVMERKINDGTTD